MQVKKKQPGLGAQAGPLISTAGLGSDRLDDQPTAQKRLGVQCYEVTGPISVKTCTEQ